MFKSPDLPFSFPEQVPTFDHFPHVIKNAAIYRQCTSKLELLNPLKAYICIYTVFIYYIYTHLFHPVLLYLRLFVGSTHGRDLQDSGN